MGIQRKLLLALLSISILPIFFMGVAFYFINKTILTELAYEEMEESAVSLALTVEQVYIAQSRSYLSGISNKIRDTFEALDESGDLDQKLYTLFLNKSFLKIGENGYISVLQSNGRVVYHPFFPYGADLSEQEIVKKSIKQKNGVYNYKWKNPQDNTERDKIAAYVRFEKRDWIILVTAYTDELKHITNIYEMRDSILSIKYGKTGYPVIMDRDCKIVIHPAIEGADGNTLADANGKKFVKEICENKNGRITYFWINPKLGEKYPRVKIGAYRHVKEMDYYILTATYLDELLEKTSVFNYITIILLIVSILIVVIISREVSKKIMLPVQETISGLQIVSGGDLRSKLMVRSKDELGKLIQVFNDFAEKIRLVIDSVKQLVLNVEYSVSVLGEKTKELSVNSARTTNSLDEINLSLEKVNSSASHAFNTMSEQKLILESVIHNMEKLSELIINNDKKMKEIVRMSDTVSGYAENGSLALGKMSNSMNKISESSRSITDIVGIINDISDQINLLALNASIEAARAGEYGLGFAVVAREISRLADRTASSTKDIKKLIHENNKEIGIGKEISTETSVAISKILDSIQSITIKLTETTSSFNLQLFVNAEANSSLEKLGNNSRGIQESIDSQKTSVEKISRELESVNSLSRSNSEKASEIDFTTSQIVGYTTGLKKASEYFKI